MTKYHKREFQQGDAVLVLSLNQRHKLAPSMERARNGSTKDKYTTIDKWTHDRFVEARQSNQQVTTRNLQQWALAAASQFPDLEFKASEAWVKIFKRKHRIRQRKITKFVSERETATMEETHAAAEKFVSIHEPSSRTTTRILSSTPTKQSGKLTTALYKDFLIDVMKPYVKEEKFLFLIDSWGGQTNPVLTDEIFTDDKGIPTCTMKVIPPKRTPLVQPCDVYFYRQVKNFIKRLQNCAYIIEQDREISSREKIVSQNSVSRTPSIVGTNFLLHVKNTGGLPPNCAMTGHVDRQWMP
ncbi:HTH CENPB-type domain-containing protein [Trichonephila clavipes]|nr:HTH CENPB-type domain-containing protein [Trichonephila clavipes]